VALDFGNGSDRTTTSTNATSYFDCVKTASGSTTCDDTSKNDLQGSIKVVTADGKTLYTVSANTLSIWNNSPAYATLSAYQTVKAGTSLKINVIGSLNSNATYTGAGENMKAGINKLYYYKKASLKYADTGSATANTIAVTTSALSVSKDTSYGAQTVVAGTANVKLGSFNIKGSSGEKVNVTSIALQVDNSSDNSTDIKNLKVYKGADNTGTQLGTTQATVTDVTDMTLSVSGFMLEKGEEVKVSVYGDVASGYNSGSSGTSTVKIAAAGVAGTGQTSQSSASGPTDQLSLQAITVETSGALTLAVADDSPVTKILVAGTPYTDANASVAKFKLSASKAEDIYITKLVLRLATDASDVAVSDATLYGSTSSSTLGDVIGTVHAMQADGTRPGYIQWDWTDTSRPKVTSNSSYYVTVKANIVSSGQTATVSSTSPAFVLADVKAEGSSSITPTNSAADLTPDSIISGTFAADSAKVKLASLLSATATTMTVSTDVGGTTGDFTDFNGGVGYYCMINADNDAAYDAGEEIVYVTGVGATGVYQIQRGLFGTTAAAVTPVALGSGVGNVYCVAAKTGVAHKVLNTKLTVSTDTTGLDTAAQADMKLAKVIFTAAANSADAAENKATVTKVRVTVTSTTASASNFKMYPEESSSNEVTGSYVSATVVEFLFGDIDHDGTADTTFSSTVYDDVVEGMARTYIIKADTTVGTNGQISLKIAKTGTSAAAVYGTSADVTWSDGAASPTTISWLNQPENASSLTLRTFSAASASGTPDTTAPTLTSNVTTNAGGGTNALAAGDYVSLVWSEAMSPAALTTVTINGSTGVIAALVNGAASATIGTFASADGSNTNFAATPSWTSSTTLVLTLTAGSGNGPYGAITPAALFRDSAGNANATTISGGGSANGAGWDA
jgi:hypothetical protein